MLDQFFESLDIKTYTVNKSKDSEILDVLNSNSGIDDAESLISHGPSVRKGNWDDRNIKEMTVLTVESISSMFEKFLPAVEPYSQYFYWKYEQYELMSIVARLVNAKAHYTLYGFMTIIEIIYSYPNKTSST